MFLTIHIILLLFALGSSAHKHKIQITNRPDIYKIIEKPNNTFEIIEPKPKKPTLREIIYFKIKETPYIDHVKKDKLTKEKEPDFDDSKRPFNNGPGFQLVEFEPINVDKSIEDDQNSKSENKSDSSDSSDSNSGSNESNPDSHESKNDSDDSSGSDPDSHESGPDSDENNYGGDKSSGSDSDSHESRNDSKESKHISIANSNNRNSGHDDSNENKINSNKSQIDNKSESKADDDKLKNGSLDPDKKGDDHDKDNENKENDNKDTSKKLDGQSGESKNINNENITPDISQSTEPTAAVKKIEAAIQERNKQFDEAKEKYQEINRKSDNSTKLVRRKRDIDFNVPPPPPALGPLNVKTLPDFIQRMISNIPALKSIVNPDESSQSNYPYENSPGTYGFHLNDDKGIVWNHLPFNNQENYINEPSNMSNKEKVEEYQENNIPDSSNDVSNSVSDDNSVYSDNDSEDSDGADDGNDKSSDDNSIGAWPFGHFYQGSMGRRGGDRFPSSTVLNGPAKPTISNNIGAPLIDFNNIKPYNPIIKDNDMDNLNKISQDTDIIDQHEPTIQVTTETYVENRYENIKDKEPEKAPIYSPLPKTEININKDLKERIKMSFDNIAKMVPPTITRFEENLVKTAVNNNEAPLTFGMKLSGGNGYVWNDLANPEIHYFVGDKLVTNKEWDEQSSKAPNNFNNYNIESTIPDEIITEANEPTSSKLHEDNGTTQRVTESYTENQSQEPTTESLIDPDKNNLDKDKNNSGDKKNNEVVQLALDDLLKKDEFWQWLTKWTAAYIEVLNENVEDLVKREVAKQLNKTMNDKNEKEKDKIDTNNNELINKNETIANVTTAEPANNTNEINTNITTTEKSIPEVNNTDDNIAPKKDQISEMNKTAPNGHKGNKTTPANAHTIYGNAIDSDHVTNIFIFYPNAENNATAKEIQAILGNKNNNVIVLGKPSNDNKESKAPDSSTDSPVDETTGIYAIDPKKDKVPISSEPTSELPEIPISKEPSATDLPSTDKNEDTTATIKTDTSDTTEATTSNNTDSSTSATTDVVSSNATESTSAKNTETTTDTAASTTVVPDTSTSSK